MKNYNELDFINKILERIPSDIKAADYLAETLNLGKESVYRRLRGIIPFTFEEVLNLSKILGFSMDELLKGNKSEYASFNVMNDKLIDAEDGFIKMYRFHSEIVGEIHKSESNQITVSSNRILAIFASSFDNLFKFFYYKWLHQFGHTSLNYKFSDVLVPDELNELRKKVISHPGTLNMHFITDRNILYNTIKEIKYYIDRGLIDKKGIKLIKNDLRMFIETFFSFSVDNVSEEELKSEVYISSLNIEGNTSYIVYDNKVLSYCWTYSDTGIYTSDTGFCALQKDWLDSLKKYTILISNSNQKMQAELYNLFINQLETLTQE
ncbi:MAG: hypothetical protein LBU84_17440 [Prevotella sp.]|jgi:hypothetical protein|nr:hypothetical protein [Prevotella sp.]